MNEKRKLLAILEEVYTAWEELFAFAETVSTAAELAFVWITSPFWVIPYTIYKKRKTGETSMAKVYGYSDDIVEIEHIEGGCTEIDCYNHDVEIRFEDGTVITVGYGKEDKGIWWIRVDQAGTASHKLRVCNDEDADIYSDILEIDAEAVSWKLVGKQ